MLIFDIKNGSAIFQNTIWINKHIPQNKFSYLRVDQHVKHEIWESSILNIQNASLSYSILTKKLKKLKILKFTFVNYK